MIKTDYDDLKRVIKRAIPLGGYSKNTVVRLIRLVVGIALLAYEKGATLTEIEETFNRQIK